MAALVSRLRACLPAFTLAATIVTVSVPVCAQYNFVRSFGTGGVVNGQFNRPEDVVIDTSGNIFIADSNNNRVQKFDTSGNYLSQFGSGGTANAQFQQPLGLGIDGSGNIFVADTSNNRVQKFDNSGNYVSQFGTQGNGNGQFGFPTDVAVNGSNTFVVDNLNKRIERFNSSGVFQSAFGSSGSGNGQLGFPFRIATDSANNIFVTDTINGNSRIAEFDSAGNFVRNITYSDAQGTLNPNGIAIDSSGRLFVTDFHDTNNPGQNRVVVLNNDGSYVTQFGSNGTGDGQFNGADGIAVDGSGNVFVTDYGNNRVEVFANVTAVPETGTVLTLAGMTMGGLAAIRRKKRRAAQA